MKKKIALALAGLLLLTALVTWPLYTKPVAAVDPETHLYWGMLGVQNSSSEQAGTTVIGLTTFSLPLQPTYNITFSSEWFLSGVGWIVDLTVPHTTYYSTPGYTYDPLIGWVNYTVTMHVDGYGWLFLNATGDVDCYTSNNSTGSYWISPSPMAGTKAADLGAHPSPGADGVAGTADDGFGDGTNDTRGSSILYLKTTITTHYASAATGWEWSPLFGYDWTGVWTTEVAYDILTEGLLNGVSVKAVGEPWEFFAGKDHPEKQVPHGHPKWNAYVTYAEAWSQYNIDTGLGSLILAIGETVKLVRDDCVIADISGDEKVTITDVVIAALAFGAEDANFGPNGVPDGPPPGGDDKIDPDPNYDARGDFKPKRGKITISDIVAIALDFGASITPDCVIRP